MLKECAASSEPTSQNTHTPRKAFESLRSFYLPIPPWKWLKNGQTGTKQPSLQITKPPPPPPSPKWSPLKFWGLLAEWGQCLEVTFKSLPPPPPVSSPGYVCTCVCVSYSFQALLGFTGVWTAGRGALIGQNEAEMDRKPPLEFLKLIFSHPHFCALPPFQSLTHSLKPPHPSSILLFFFLNALHQHRSAFEASAVKRCRCCSTNFSHPFYSCHSTISQKHFESAGGSFQPLITPTQ